MGETGTGKTFTINFLSEIIGPNVKLVKLVVDGGTTKEDIDQFLQTQIRLVNNEREKEILSIFENIDKHNDMFKTKVLTVWAEIMLKKGKNDIYSRESALKKIDEIIKDLTYEGEKDDFKKYLEFHINSFYDDIERKIQHFLVFFDEVNTAPCQWYIKEIIIDRYFKGDKLPQFVHFICAVNPYRKIRDEIKGKIKALEIKSENDNDELKDLIYKVYRMPESFIPYIYPADPQRVKVENEKYTDFDKSIKKVVSKQLTLPTADDDNNKHFSFTSTYTIPFDDKFYSDHPGISKENNNKIMEEMNIYACQKLLEVYDDNSYSSLREPERCIQITRWAYKFGLSEEFDNGNKKTEYILQRMTKAFIFGLTIAYTIRLSNDSDSKNPESERTKFIKDLLEKWKEIVKGTENQSININCIENDEGDDYKKWDTFIDNEMTSYAKFFVDEDSDCVSINTSLKENIWTAYVCIMNNIPLWIIGKPGTSKSLAINIVLKNLKNRVHLLNDDFFRRIQKVPEVFYQTYMCSSQSTTEAIKGQVKNLIQNSLKNLQFNSTDNKRHDTIKVQILEEMGHADISPYRPLKCLHDIIDNGYKIREKSYPIVLIGLSNYKMDSAKLNRGILLLRGELSKKDLSTIGIEIMKSTEYALANKKSKNNLDEFKIEKEEIKKFWEGSSMKGEEKRINYFLKYFQEETKNITPEYQKFIGLRDLYGFFQSTAYKIFMRKDKCKPKYINTYINRNFSGLGFIDNEMSKLPQNLFEKGWFQKEGKKYMKENHLDLIKSNEENLYLRDLKTPIVRHMIIVDLTNSFVDIMPSLHLDQDNEKISTQLFFSTNLSDYPDEVWITDQLNEILKCMSEGKQIVFIGEHPCFNSLYEVFNVRYDSDGSNHYAQISYKGDSHSFPINPDFRAIIVFNQNEYQSQPPPFLNRFEKIVFTNSHIPDETKNFCKEFKEKFPNEIINSLFECSSFDENENSLYSSLTVFKNIKQKKKIDFNGFDFYLFNLLSINPSLFYFLLRNQKIKDNNIKMAMKESSFLHVSINELLKTYKNDKIKIESNIINYIIKQWRDNKGIQSIVLVKDIDDSEEFIKNSLNEFGSVIIYRNNNFGGFEKTIESQLVSMNNNNNDIIILLIVDEPKSIKGLIHCIQQGLQSIRNKYQHNIDIHTFIALKMKEKIEEDPLKLVQTFEWPILYLDYFCGSSNMFTFSHFEKSFEEFVKEFLKDSKDNIINKVKEYYNREDQDLIESFIGGFKEDFIKEYIQDTFKDSEASTQTILFRFLDNLSSPPSSIIQFLYKSLITCIANIYSYHLSNILSGYNKKDDLQKNNSNIQKRINYLIYNPFYNENCISLMFKDNTPNISSIDHRYISKNFNFYQLLWRSSFDSPNFKSIQEKIGVNSPTSVYMDNEIKKIIRTMDEEETNENSIDDAFFASYILHVNPNIYAEEKFKEFVLFYKDIICTFLFPGTKCKDLLTTELKDPLIVNFTVKLSNLNDLINYESKSEMIKKEVTSDNNDTKTSILLIYTLGNIFKKIEEYQKFQEYFSFFQLHFRFILPIKLQIKDIVLDDDELEEEKSEIIKKINYYSMINDLFFMFKDGLEVSVQKADYQIIHKSSNKDLTKDIIDIIINKLFIEGERESPRLFLYSKYLANTNDLFCFIDEFQIFKEEIREGRTEGRYHRAGNPERQITASKLRIRK